MRQPIFCPVRPLPMGIVPVLSSFSNPNYSRIWVMCFSYLAASGQSQHVLLGRRELPGLGLGAVGPRLARLHGGGAAQGVVERALGGRARQLRGDVEVLLGRGEVPGQGRERVGARVGARQHRRLRGGGRRGIAGVGGGRRDGRAPRGGKGRLGEVARALLRGLVSLAGAAGRGGGGEGGGQEAGYVGECVADVRHFVFRVLWYRGMRRWFRCCRDPGRILSDMEYFKWVY